MKPCIDGFVLPIPRVQIAAYARVARLAHLMDPKALPFDAKRMIFGGFKSVVSR